MRPERIVFRIHALERMLERQLDTKDIREVLENGEVIENYPDDIPYPSRLMLGYPKGEPIHVVLAENTKEHEIIVITAYEPDSDKWYPDFRRRK